MSAVLGQGIIPSGAIGTELTTVTRRAFIPKAIVQIYQSRALLAAALANAQFASGGVSSVTVPVQGAPFVTPQVTDYGGGFNQPTAQQGMFEADFNLCAYIAPIPFLGFEGIVQQNAAIVPLIEARMNDAGNGLGALIGDDMVLNGTYGTQNIDGLPLMKENSGFYGNIDRATSAYWHGNDHATFSGVAPTRQNMLECVASAAAFNGGEMPNFGVMSLGTWAKLAQDFVGQERYLITPGTGFDGSTQGARSAFTALMVAGVPFYADLSIPDGAVYLLNTRYISMYIHEAAAFAFTGFASTLPNFTLGYVGAVVVVLQFLTVKPKSVSYFPGFLFLTL